MSTTRRSCRKQLCHRGTGLDRVKESLVRNKNEQISRIEAFLEEWLMTFSLEEVRHHLGRLALNHTRQHQRIKAIHRAVKQDHAPPAQASHRRA